MNYATGRPIISNNDCAAVYGSSIRDSSICTSGQGGVGTCNGDSGGPLNLEPAAGSNQYTQVGVTSFVSSAGCESGYPDGFARVSYFIDWINANTGLNFA